MYDILFYKDEKGKSEIIEYLDELKEIREIARARKNMQDFLERKGKI